MNDFIFTPEQELVINDLLTTDAPQTTGTLHSNEGYCCLGRMCEVLEVPVYKVSSERFEVHTYGTEESHASSVLPNGVHEKLHLRNDSGFFKHDLCTTEWQKELEGLICNHLTELNDVVGWPFAKIGRFIKENPLAVFTNHPNEEAAA